MTTRNFPILVVALVLLSAVPTLAQDNGPDPAWGRCRNDRECVEIAVPCGRSVVNKKFEKTAAAYYENHAFEALQCDKTANAHGHVICNTYAPCPADKSEQCVVEVGSCIIIGAPAR